MEKLKDEFLGKREQTGKDAAAKAAPAATPSFATQALLTDLHALYVRCCDGAANLPRFLLNRLLFAPLNILGALVSGGGRAREAGQSGGTEDPAPLVPLLKYRSAAPALNGYRFRCRKLE